jgi:hypothetical protein
MTSHHGGLQTHYDGISKRLMSMMETVSATIRHAGETGHSNELILTRFLQSFLPQKYSVSTGKVVAAKPRCFIRAPHLDCC